MLKKKKIISLIVLVTTLTLTFSTTKANAAENSTDNLAEIEATSQETTESEPNIIPITSDNINKYCGENLTADTIPSNFDNSTNSTYSKFLPEVDNQGLLGSCTAFACTYYTFTFEMAKKNNLAVKDSNGKNLLDNVFSPKWIYNLCNKSINKGINPLDNFLTLQQIGGVSLKDCPYPYVMDSNKIIPSYYQDWSANKDLWRNASKNKVDKILKFELTSRNTRENISEDTIVQSPKDENISLLKQYIASGNIIPVITHMNFFQQSITGVITNPGNCSFTKQDENEKTIYLTKNIYSNEQAITSVADDPTSLHSITIVGYDDNIWIDINHDNIVQESEKGAFKAVNSWGTSYHNNGYIWFAYDSLNKVSAVPNYSPANNSSEKTIADSRGHGFHTTLYGITVTNTDYSDYQIEFTLDTTCRNDIELLLGYGDGSTLTTSPFNDLFFNGNNGNTTFSGDPNITEGSFTIDLKHLEKTADINLSQTNRFYITFINKNNIPLTIKDVNLVDSNGNILKRINTNNVTLSNSAKRFEIINIDSTPTITPSLTAPTLTRVAGSKNVLNSKYNVGKLVATIPSYNTAIKAELYNNNSLIDSTYINDIQSCSTLLFDEKIGLVGHVGTNEFRLVLTDNDGNTVSTTFPPFELTDFNVAELKSSTNISENGEFSFSFIIPEDAWVCSWTLLEDGKEVPEFTNVPFDFPINTPVTSDQLITFSGTSSVAAVHEYQVVIRRKYASSVESNKIKIFNLDAVSEFYNTTPDSPNWNPDLDLNNDNIIDLFDLVLMSNSSTTN